ncbi:NINE protein [Arthrobacter sp. Soc17.1.1.1]|uniref:TM2 domain-containing protein n=1 Tax=Arthrobacter sp. Soc17.1.1.1 TaxID=3121277 RepID=UPI002FE4D88D
MSSSANGSDRQPDGSSHEHSDGQEQDGSAPGSTPHGAGQGPTAPEDPSPDRSRAGDAGTSPMEPVTRPYTPVSEDPYAQPSSGDAPSGQAPARDPYAQPSPQNPSAHQSPASNPYIQGYPQGPQGQPSPGQAGYNQAGYNQAGYNQAGYNQGGYPQGQYGQPYAPQKSRVVAGVLGILLGSLGIHRFYLGYTTIGVVLVLMSTVGVFLTFGLSAIAAGIWGLVEGILILVGSGSFRTDARGIPLRD